jgi:hypothetical protein
LLAEFIIIGADIFKLAAVRRSPLPPSPWPLPPVKKCKKFEYRPSPPPVSFWLPWLGANDMADAEDTVGDIVMPEVESVETTERRFIAFAACEFLKDS